MTDMTGYWCCVLFTALIWWLNGNFLYFLSETWFRDLSLEYISLENYFIEVPLLSGTISYLSGLLFDCNLKSLEAYWYTNKRVSKWHCIIDDFIFSINRRVTGSKFCLFNLGHVIKSANDHCLLTGLAFNRDRPLIETMILFNQRINMHQNIEKSMVNICIPKYIRSDVRNIQIYSRADTGLLHEEPGLSSRLYWWEDYL